MSYSIEDPTIIWLKIYYGDFSTFSSDDGSWLDAPDTDVQIILLWRADHNTRILRGTDYYWHDSLADFYMFGCTNTFIDAHGDIKIGSWASAENFTQIYWNALLDVRELYYPGKYTGPDFPDQSPLVDSEPPL